MDVKYFVNNLQDAMFVQLLGFLSPTNQLVVVSAYVYMVSLREEGKEKKK